MTQGLVRVSSTRRVGVLSSLVCACLVALAACSESVETRPPTVLRVLMTDDWVTPPFVAAVRDFERRHENVRVDVDSSQISHMLETIAAATRSGTPPDVVQAHAFAAGAQGLAEPLDDLWEEALDPSEFLPGAMEDVTWAGRRYGVPLDTNALFLLYNADHFASAGVPLPEAPLTFEGFEKVARRVSTPDGSRRALAVPTSTWWAYGWISANGGDVVQVATDGSVQLTLDAPEVVGALDFLSRLVRANLIFPPRAADSHSGDALSLFRAGSATMLATGSWDLAIVRRDAGGDRYRAVPLPRGAGDERSGTVMGGSSLFVPKGSQLRQLAFDFMVHVTSDRYALRLAKEEGRLPVRSRLYQDPYFQSPDLITVLEGLRSAHPFTLEAFPEAGRVFAEAVDEVLRTGRDATTVLREAQERATQLLPADAARRP
ncbi:MAG: extracellular solute-binding protein [Actinomycetota bacterium]|nr:extracellular solute-binding protein [Actinomycetota bacterium]